MAILVGIDEAGYGPLLGPLVVSASVFEVTDDLLETCLWQALRGSVAKTRQQSRGRVVINDSKKLHDGTGRYQTLQRGVLAWLTAADAPAPARLADLLARLGADCSGELRDYPWYGPTAGDWPLRYDGGDVATAAAALKSDLHRREIRKTALWSRPVMVGRFNQLASATQNKAAVLFFFVSQLIDQTCTQWPSENLHILVDKQSGRSHYREHLQRLLPEMSLKIVNEDNGLSRYRLTGPGRTVDISFVQGGDNKYLPIALASMASKYLRELFMEMLNAYFGRHCPQLKPTAGYYQDGRRFLKDLDAHNLNGHLAPQHLLVRDR